MDDVEQDSQLTSSNLTTEIDVEGDITVPGAPDSDDEYSTLDEPVSETLVPFTTTYFLLIIRVMIFRLRHIVEGNSY